MIPKPLARRAARALLMVAAAAVSAAAVFAAPDASAQAPRPQVDPARTGDLLWGVNGHPLTSYPGISFEQQLDLAGALGARSYRVDVTRTDQADALGRLIAAARARGIDVLPILIPPVNLDAAAEPALYRAAFAFAHALAVRFGPDVPVWELGNELENYAIIKPCETRIDGTTYPCEWGPAGGVGPLDYHGPRLAKVIAVLRGLSDGVRGAAPGARRAMGTAGWGHTGFFEHLKTAGVEWDISVWHTYDAHREWAYKILASYGKPIWITEFNHDFGSSRDGEEGQAEGLRRTIAEMRGFARTYGIEAAHVYELFDETYWAPSFEASMGLVRLTKTPDGGWTPGSPKPAFEAVRALINPGR